MDFGKNEKQISSDELLPMIILSFLSSGRYKIDEYKQCLFYINITM